MSLLTAKNQKTKGRKSSVQDKKTNKILVIDSELDILFSIKQVLEYKGRSVAVADNRKDALKKFKQHNPALVVMDMMTPKESGLDLIKQIIKINPNSRIAICTSTFFEESEKQRILKSRNIVDFIEKPFDLDDFVERVGRNL